MTRYLPAELIIRINAENCGTGAGVRSREGVEAAAARPLTSFGGVELYPTIWQKAGVLLHALASTQSFLDGNKRTAWIAAIEMLRHNGHTLRAIPHISAEAFVLAVATGLLDPIEAGDWLREHRLRASDRLDYMIVGDECRSDESATFSISGAQVGTVVTQEYPVVHQMGVVTRIIWDAIDFDTHPMLTIRVANAAGSARLLEPPPELLDAAMAATFRHPSFDELVEACADQRLIPATPLPDTSGRFGYGMHPSIYVENILVGLTEPCAFQIVVLLDGELLARREIRAHHVTSFTWDM